MDEFEKLEKSLSKKRPARNRSLVSLSLILILLGVTFTFAGVSYLRGKSVISADVQNPPNPTEPGIQNPPNPTEPNGDFTFLPGWTLVSGKNLADKDMSTFKNAGLVLYSFNDLAYPNRDWSAYPGADNVDTLIRPQAPYGYYVYNPGSTNVQISLTSKAASSDSQEIIARGWHLLYWPGEAADQNALLSNISLTYSDGTVMSVKDAVSPDNHKASVMVYVVLNGQASDVTSAVKQLGATDSDKIISKIPAKSFFWVYFRRTKDRVTDIKILDQSTSTPTVTATVSNSSSI